MLFLANTLYSQVSINLNIGTPPQWGPVGYNEVSYYYLPDVEAYYDVRSSMFIYYERGSWIHRSNLPRRYRNYDLYGGYKVVMKDYHGNKPYDHFKEHRSKYARGYHDHSQKNIGKRPGRGNAGGKMHTERSSLKKGNHDNGRAKGQEHGNNKERGQGHDGGKGKGKNK